MISINRHSLTTDIAATERAIIDRDMLLNPAELYQPTTAIKEESTHFPSKPGSELNDSALRRGNTKLSKLALLPQVSDMESQNRDLNSNLIDQEEPEESSNSRNGIINIKFKTDTTVTKFQPYQ